MGEPTPGLARTRAVEELAERRFDLLVVGGGIIGAGIAAHAARAGLAVALVDAGDFGGATSSASSKLIHGGLRYLRLGDVRLVREAHHERRVLTKIVAPHLVRRTQFLLPLYQKGPYRPTFVQSGIVLYSVLALSRLNWLVSRERARELVPPLRLEGLRSCALYADATTNDARLCLANVRAAADAGGCVLNEAEVVALRSVRGRVTGAEVQVGGEQVTVESRLVVNAAGPWVDRVRRLEDPRAGTSVRLSRGAHVLVPAEGDWAAALTIPQDDVRVTFAVPWSGMLLLGTTDSPHEGDPADVAVGPADVEESWQRPRSRSTRHSSHPTVCARPTPACACSQPARGRASARGGKSCSRGAPEACSTSPAASSRPTAASPSRRSLACSPSSACTGSTGGRGRSPAPPDSNTSPCRWTSSPSSGRTSSTSTEAWRRRFSRRLRTTLLFSNG